MEFDRRGLLMSLGALAVAGCSGGDGEGTSPTPAPTPTPTPSMTLTPMKLSDPARIAPVWQAFRAGFVQPDGRIVDTGNNRISHSEGQGYGLILAAIADDRPTFEAILRWTETVLARSGGASFSWRNDPQAVNQIGDPNNASDGDILIAWGLMLGADRWQVPAYAARAAAIRKAIGATMVRRIGDDSFLLPGAVGFEEDGRTTLNPSYYVWPALAAFAAADGAAAWAPVIVGGQRLLRLARFGPHALPTDWVDLSDDGRASPAAGRPPRFGFDAVRVPLYLAMVGQQAQADPVLRYWQSFGGQPIPAWVDVVSGEVAPFSLSDGGMAVVHRTLGQPVDPTPTGSDYYASVLKALSLA